MTKTSDIINEKILEKDEDQKFDTKIFQDIRKSFKLGEMIKVKDDETKKEVDGEVIFVGKRFCTVKLKQGQPISINYASMIDKNSKEMYSTTVRRVEKQ